MKVIKNMLLEIVTLILMMINLYMFFIQSGIARIQQTTQEEFDAFWRTLSILSLIILIIVVMVYIVSVKVFKRNMQPKFRSICARPQFISCRRRCLLFGRSALSHSPLIFVAAVLYIVYLVQTIVNIRKF